MSVRDVNGIINASDEVLGRPLTLPCGVTLKNRIAKSAMSDSLGDGAGNATPEQARLYERWAEGGNALSIIGEVQGTPRFPEKPGNLVLGPQSNDAALLTLVERGQSNGAALWPQLGHAGALSHGPISAPAGPSVLDLEGLQCAELTVDDIRALPDLYAAAAAHAKTVGFGGVQIHAGHGFLLSQFLSPLFNHRADVYGGSVAARCRVIREVIDAVRRAVGAEFPIGIKMNATDMLEGGLTEDDALEVVRLLNETSIDLIDISGGTYFPGAPASSDAGAKGGPYFLAFARRAKGVTNVPLMLTGGFKRRDQAIEAIASGAVDIIGLARGMVLNPRLANAWLSRAGGDPAFPKFDAPGPGAVTAWYTMRLTALANDQEEDFVMDSASALQCYDRRDDEKCVKWREAFSSA